jgi:hypothetical protein
MISFGGGKWTLCWRHELGERKRTLRMRDPFWAYQWLQRSCTGPSAIPTLRRLLAERGSGDLWRATDDTILKLVADKLADQQIWVCEDEPPVPSRGGGKVEDPPPPAAPAAAAFPMDQRKTGGFTAVKSGADGPLFPADAHLVAIAQVLKDAARLGTPF